MSMGCIMGGDGTYLQLRHEHAEPHWRGPDYWAVSSSMRRQSGWETALWGSSRRSHWARSGGRRRSRRAASALVLEGGRHSCIEADCTGWWRVIGAAAGVRVWRAKRVSHGGGWVLGGGSTAVGVGIWRKETRGESASESEMG